MEFGLKLISLGPNGYFWWPTCRKKGYLNFHFRHIIPRSLLVLTDFLVQSSGPPGVSSPQGAGGPHFLGATLGTGLGGGVRLRF